MTKEYKKADIEDKIGSAIALLEAIQNNIKNIDLQKIEQISKQTNEIITLINVKELDINPLDLEHYNQMCYLVKEMIVLEQSIINSVINSIAPNLEASNYARGVYKNINKNKQEFGSDDASILWGLVKSISKPFSYIMDLFEYVTPDKWGVATTWEKTKIVTGVTLTLLGVACIVTAIALTLATPVGALVPALVGGIGLTVSVGGIGFGLAAFFSCTFGGIFLKVTDKTLDKRVKKIEELEKINLKCNNFINSIDEDIRINLATRNELFANDSITDYRPHAMTFSQSPSQRSNINSTLSDFKAKLDNIKVKLKS